MIWEEWVSRGLDTDELWASTPDEVAGVLRRVRERDEHMNKLAGMIAAQIVNMSGKTAQRTVEWSDFFRQAGDGTPRLSEQAQQRFEARPLMRVVQPKRRRRRLST